MKMLLEILVFGLVISFMTGARCEVTEVFAEAGSSAVLPCKCNPSSPFPRAVVWSKADLGTIWRKQKSGLQFWGSQGRMQHVRCPHFDYERGDYSLEINNVSEEDGGTYFCKIGNVNQVSNEIRLRIIKVSISPSTAMAGESVSISCNVTPWPNEANVQWTLNKSPYVPRSITNRGASKRVVRVEATSKVSGNWACAVTYQGKEGQASSTLTMKGIIKPHKDSTKLYSAVGSAVSLPCVFPPGLTPTNPVWEKLKPGSLYYPVPGPLPASFSQSLPSPQNPWDLSASATEVGFEEAGRYRCSATAGGQRFTRSMQLVVAKIVSSSAQKTKHSVTLTCQLTDESEVTDYEWVHVVYNHNNTPSAEFIQKGKTLTINTASEKNQGEWVCRFYGGEGILGNVTYHLQQLSAVTGEKSSTPAQNTSVIVGLCILLLVLLLVLAQMYKNHQRRKRILQYPALETIIHTASNEREERERNRVKE